MQPFFSIIIPAYNRAYILPRTIESVINQSYSNWELIVIDDGSKDNTADLLKSYLGDPRIHYHYQNNSERSAARNNGISKSTGKYICFLDSDDEFLPQHLSKLYELIQLKSNPIALFYTDCFMAFEDGTKTEIHNSPENNDPWHVFFLKNSIIPARICAHKEIFDTVKFREDIVIVEDTVLWTSIALKFPVFHLNESTVNYHWHDDNSVNIAKNCFLPRLKGLQKMFAETEIDTKVPKSIKKSLYSGCYYGIAKHYELKRSFFKMTKNAVLSIICDLKSPQNKAKLFMIYSFFKKA